MTTSALLRDKLAPAVGRVILKYTFGADVAAIGGPFLDWLSSKLKSKDEARQAERLAHDVAERVVAGLVPVFEREHSADLNPEAAALALGDTLDQHFDSKFLVAHDLDPKRTTDAAFALRPLSDLRQEAYASDDIELYRRALPVLVRRLVGEAKQFAGFDVANASEVLKRLRTLAEQGRRVEEGVQSLVRAREVWERRRAEQWREFERAYADAVLDRWNRLELFGIDVSAEVQREQRLSVAYIPLNLQSEDTETSETAGHLASFEELLASAAQEERPLVILGEAGSGKSTLLRWAACRAISRATDTHEPNPFVPHRHEPVSLLALGAHARAESAEHFAWWGRVPFLLRLREVKDGVLPKEHEWPGKSAALPRDPPPEWLEQILGAGQGLILVDGLDELGSSGRDVARDTLRSILRDRRGNVVVITSRPGAFDASWFRDVAYQLATIRAMSPSQREGCIANWHKAVAQARPDQEEEVRQLGKELTHKIRVSPYIQEPTTNPLVCAATCALHYGRRVTCRAGSSICSTPSAAC